MASEQEDRFASMRELAHAAQSSIEEIRETADRDFQTVDNDASRQAEQLQRIQQSAGTAVDALQKLTDIARHARSYQAQAHQGHAE